MTALKHNIELFYIRSFFFRLWFFKIGATVLVSWNFPIVSETTQISKVKKILEILTTVFLDKQVKSWLIRVVDHN